MANQSKLMFYLTGRAKDSFFSPHLTFFYMKVLSISNNRGKKLYIKIDSSPPVGKRIKPFLIFQKKQLENFTKNLSPAERSRRTKWGKCPEGHTSVCVVFVHSLPSSSSIPSSQDAMDGGDKQKYAYSVLL